jgi:outer membrane immunogenic protein
MRTKKLFATACFALCASATPILAADLIPEEPIAPVVDWTGLHLGVGVGGNFMFADTDAHASASHVECEGICAVIADVVEIPQVPSFYSLFIEAENHSDLGDAGLFGTVEGGFDLQLGSKFVLGIVGNFDFGQGLKAKSETEGTVDVEFEGARPDVHSFTDFDVAVKMDDSWGIGGRLGFLASESTLIYGIGGYTRAKFKAHADLEGGFEISPCISGICDDELEVSASDSDWLAGFFVGGGFETLLTEHLSLKGEYRYANYESLSFKHYDNWSGECGNNTCFESESLEMRIDPVVHSVRAVLSWRF